MPSALDLNYPVAVQVVVLAAAVEQVVVPEKAAATEMPDQAEKAVDLETAREMMKAEPEHQKTAAAAAVMSAQAEKPADLEKAAATVMSAQAEKAVDLETAREMMKAEPEHQ